MLARKARFSFWQHLTGEDVPEFDLEVRVFDVIAPCYRRQDMLVMEVRRKCQAFESAQLLSGLALHLASKIAPARFPSAPSTPPRAL